MLGLSAGLERVRRRCGMRRMRSTRHPFLLDSVWLDKWRFDEAERLFHEAGQRRPEAGVGTPAPDGTGKRRQEKCAPRYRPVAVREEAAAAGDPGTPARELRPAVACHHLVAGVWINRDTFDEAELLFLTRSQARAVPRSLPIPIPSSRRSPKPRPTPDEGYASVGATPVTPAAPSPRGNGTYPTVPIDRPPAREVRLEEPRPIPDEGYASVGATPVTPATPGPRGNGTSPTAPIDRPPAREVWLEKTRPTPDEGYASVGSTPVIPATPNLQGNGTSPIDRPPAREVWLEKTWPILDEGYASVSATPMTPATPTPPASGTSPTAPIHRPPAREVWLEKPLYDEAERLYHEGRAEPRDGPHRSGAAPPPTPRAAHPGPAPKPGPPPASAHRHLVHRDNEPVWFNRAAHDAAELRLHLPDGRGVTGKTQELPAASPPAPPTERTIPAPRSPGTQDKTMAVNVLANENIWFDKCKYDDAEMKYYSQTHDSVPANTPVQNTARNPPATQENGASNILRDIARARENIQKSLAGSAMQGGDGELCSRVTALEKENLGLHKEVEKLRLTLSKLELRLSTVEKSLGGSKPAVCPPAPTHAQPAAQQPVEDGDDEIDLFGSSDEEESRESERVREERLRQYAAKKSNKPGLVAKSSILLDVKPWDDETDMGKLEECVRTVQMDGLVWGASKLVPVGYGIKKLQIQCVVEDDKVGTDQLEEGITKFEDYVQSVDVAAFNKV